MDGPSLYDIDILAWSEEQAAALRALGGQNALDIENVAEEIEAVGRSQLNAVESRLQRIFEHLMKAAYAPGSRARSHWRTEILVWHGDILRSMTRSMRQRIDLASLWRRARRIAEARLQDAGAVFPRNTPAICPFELADFLDEEFDFDGCIARILAAAEA